VELGFIFRHLLLIVLLTTTPLKAESLLQEITPYLLPDNHPIKADLDQLFTSSRALFNLKTLEKAGFKKSRLRKFTRLLVTSHPAFPGYIFKLFLDVQRYPKNRPEYKFWFLRCQGARQIQALITANNLQSLFKVPQKWIYLLPNYPKPPLGYFPKLTLLVEEDMNILSEKENKKMWASSAVNTPLLEGLYLILKTVGLRDCTKPDNIPFSHDGKVAFVDTQTFDEKVDYKRFTRYLSKPNQKIWKALTH
jgi:hypothetical protein